MANFSALSLTLFADMPAFMDRTGASPDVAVELQFEQRRVVLQPLTAELSCDMSVFDVKGLSFGG